MSTYANFYLRTPHGDYMTLGNFSRNHAIYKAFEAESLLEYEKCRVITHKEFVGVIMHLIDEERKRKEDKLRLFEHRRTIMECNNPMSEKISALRDIDTELQFLEEDLEELIYSEGVIGVYKELICQISTSYDYEDVIYAGIEAPPPDVNSCVPSDESEGQV